MIGTDPTRCRDPTFLWDRSWGGARLPGKCMAGHVIPGRRRSSVSKAEREGGCWAVNQEHFMSPPS